MCSLKARGTCRGLEKGKSDIDFFVVINTIELFC
jgi:hypothetical protein